MICETFLNTSECFGKIYILKPLWKQLLNLLQIRLTYTWILMNVFESSFTIPVPEVGTYASKHRSKFLHCDPRVKARRTEDQKKTQIKHTPYLSWMVNQGSYMSWKPCFVKSPIPILTFDKVKRCFKSEKFTNWRYYFTKNNPKFNETLEIAFSSFQSVLF